MATLEEDLRAIESVEILGTVDEGELRTFARIEAGGRETLVWYALDGAGGIAAVEITDDPPMLVVAPAGSGTYRPADPTGGGPAVILVFAAQEVTVTGPNSTVTARRLPDAEEPAVPPMASAPAVTPAGSPTPARSLSSTQPSEGDLARQRRR